MAEAPTNQAASMQTTFVNGAPTNLLADAVVAERHAESWRVKGQFYRNAGASDLAKKMFLAAAALQRVVAQLREDGE